MTLREEVIDSFRDSSVPILEDATSVALINRHGIDGILRFDDDFDGVVRRFDPLDV